MRGDDMAEATMTITTTGGVLSLDLYAMLGTEYEAELIIIMGRLWAVFVEMHTRGN